MVQTACCTEGAQFSETTSKLVAEMMTELKHVSLFNPLKSNVIKWLHFECSAPFIAERQSVRMSD